MKYVNDEKLSSWLLSICTKTLSSNSKSFTIVLGDTIKVTCTVFPN